MLCNLGFAIWAMLSRLCSLGYAIQAMQSRLCNLMFWKHSGFQARGSAVQGALVTPLLAQCGALSIACQVTPLLA